MLLWSLHLITHTRWCGKQRGWWGWGRGIFWKLTQGVWRVGLYERLLEHIRSIICSYHLRKWKDRVKTYPRGVMIVWYWRSVISVGVWCHISTWHIIILTVGLIHLLCIWMWLLLLLSRYCIRYRIWTNTKINHTIFRIISKKKNKLFKCTYDLNSIFTLTSLQGHSL